LPQTISILEVVDDLLFIKWTFTFIVGVLAQRMQRILLRMVIAFTVCIMPSIIVLVLHILVAPYTNPYWIENYSVEVKFWKVSNCYQQQYPQPLEIECFWECKIFILPKFYLNLLKFCLNWLPKICYGLQPHLRALRRGEALNNINP